MDSSVSPNIMEAMSPSGAPSSEALGEASSEVVELESSEIAKGKTPLPKLQLVIVSLIQFTETLAGLVIYPFVNQYVRESGVTGGDEKKTGYYAGLIESIFFIAEASTVVFWGIASDRFGRKPVLLLGPLGLAGALLGFGLAGSFPLMLISRAFQGVSKSIIAEISDSTNMADAYSFGPLVWTMGSTIAPIIGGVLSRPAEQWPGVFARYQLFVDHPYFLPCAAAACIALAASFVAMIGLRETLPSAIEKKAQKNQDHAEEARLLDDGGSDYGSIHTERGVESGLQSERRVTFRDLMIPRIINALVVYGTLEFVEMAMAVIRPLVWSTSIELGGLGFAPQQIGIILSVWGFLNASLQACFLGPVIRRIGPKNVLLCTFSCYVITILLYPLLRYLVMASGRANSLAKAVLAVQLICGFSVSASFGAIQLIIVGSAPSRSALGATNGMAQAVAASMKGAAPSIASSLFSVSLERQLLGGNFVFLLLFILVLVGLQRIARLSS